MCGKLESPVSSIGAALLKRLESVQRPGDFCTGGLRTIFMPAIDVAGVGRIALPLLPAQAEALVAIAEAAPYGRGADTIIDSSVRREPGKPRDPRSARPVPRCEDPH